MAIMQAPNRSPAAPADGPRERYTTYPAALAVVTTIFFMWGFLTCLNDILIPHLKALFELNYKQAMLVQFTFFGAYFLMSLPAGWLVGAPFKRGERVVVQGAEALVAVDAAAVPGRAADAPDD